MARVGKGLTAKAVLELGPGLHADGDGLYLQVSKAGARSWIFRYQFNRRRRDMGLGSVRDIPITEARNRVRDLRRGLTNGVDPLEARATAEATARAAAASAMTFKEAAEAYIAANRAAWRNAKHAAQWSSTLEQHAFPEIGALPVSAIETSHVLACLEPIWTTKTETASRLRGRIEAVLDWATIRGRRKGENPARWRGHLAHVLPAPRRISRPTHHKSMPYQQLPAFWPKLQMADGMGARALEALILTAARTGEILGATWLEIDLEEAVWSIPAERMKAGRDHRVPLSEPAMALFRKLRAIREADDGFVFRGARVGRPLSNMALSMTLRRMKADCTAHGFRASFRTWAADCAHAPADVCEAALAHAPGSQVVAAYQRGDLFEKRRALMRQWANFLGSEV